MEIFTYDSRGNLLTESRQATSDISGSAGNAASVVGTPRIKSFTYNSREQLTSVSDTVSNAKNTTLYSYDTNGNLASLSNALGHTTTFANYDLNGRVGTIVQPNGLVTNYTYTPRGAVSSSETILADGVGEMTRYEYDQAGQLVKTILPNGLAYYFNYDRAHRLILAQDAMGNSVEYTLDRLGNRVSEKLRDSTGNLSQEVSRVFNSLNQLIQVTGANH